MAVLFFLIGLELESEMLEGKLKTHADVLLPDMAAAGRLIAPEMLYLMVMAKTT